MIEIAYILAVQALLWGLYMALPYAALRPLWRGRPRATCVAMAMLFGVVSQSALGMAWTRFVQRPAQGQGLLYLACWIAIGFFFRRKRISGDQRNMSAFTGLGAIVILALVVRLVHPYQTAALGQSDAYSHLAMFREIVAQGFLGHAAYPPAYSWVMAMPAALIGLDVYWIARFGGAFFGGGLVLAVHFLLNEGLRSRTGAWMGAFLVAAFPGLMHLIKTGIGAFANQYGLFLLPFIFGGWLMLGHRDKSSTRDGVILAVALIGLLLTVPMMLLHALPILVLCEVFSGMRTIRRLPILARRLLFLGTTLLALLGAALTLGARRILSSAVVVLTTADEATAAQMATESMGEAAAAGALLRDFFTWKRFGIGYLPVDTVLLLLCAMFSWVALSGIRRKRADGLLLGIWGGLTSLQAMTGLFQFTAYQREGWSMLLALGCGTALVGAMIWNRCQWSRHPVRIGMAACAIWALIMPPGHRLTNSVAEEEWVLLARALRSYPVLSGEDENLGAFLADQIHREQELLIVTRPLLQEKMLAAVAGTVPGVIFSDRDIWKDYPQRLESAVQSLVLLDRLPDNPPGALGKLAGINPELTRSFLEQQQRSYAFNYQLDAHLSAMDSNVWHIVCHDFGEHTRIFYTRRRLERIQ